MRSVAVGEAEPVAEVGGDDDRHSERQHQQESVTRSTASKQRQPAASLSHVPLPEYGFPSLFLCGGMRGMVISMPIL